MDSEVTVEEMNNLMEKVDEFYASMGNPKITVKYLADLIIKRLKSDRDYCLAVEGLKGTGKSNLALLVSLMMSRYNGVYKSKTDGRLVRATGRTKPMNPEMWERVSVDFNFEKNMSFLDDGAKIKKKFFAISKFAPFIIDEGSKALHKFRWTDRLQQILIQMSDSERWQNKATIICIPNFRELTSVFRNDRVQLRCYVYKRHTNLGYASAIISTRDPGRWSSDPWFIDENFKTYENYLRKIPFLNRTWQHVLSAEKKLRGYGGEFHFPSLKDIAPTIWQKYFDYKVHNAMIEYDDSEDDENSKRVNKWKYATKMLLSQLKERFPEIKWSELSKLTSISTSALKNTYTQVFDIGIEKDIRKRVSEEIAGKPIE